MILRSQLSSTLRPLVIQQRACVHISRIGSQPIPIPPSVTLEPTPEAINISGPLGETAIPLRPYMQLDFLEPGQGKNKGTNLKALALAVEDAEVREQRQMWGTTRTLIDNAIIGMSEGFEVPLYLVGVGYRVAVEDDPRGTLDGGNGTRLNMKIGYSHSVLVPVPPGIKATTPTATKIVLQCNSNYQLGQFAALIQQKRKPEPYKGKGIFIANETIRLKKAKRR